MVDIEAVKIANPIEDVIAETVELQKSGRDFRGRRRGVGEHSLIVQPWRGCYFWNSKGEQGDVINWVMHRQDCEFKEAVEWLYRRASLPLPTWGKEGKELKALRASRARSDVMTVACEYWHRLLLQSEQAMDYCRGRSWTDKVIEQARLGFSGNDSEGLRAELRQYNINLGGPVARAVLRCPKGMLIYPVWTAGRATYFAGRAATTTDKRHWNPPRDLVGERLPYVNAEYYAGAELVVVVEGQADAISLAQWGIPAIALAGTSADKKLLQALTRHQTVVLGLDEGQQVTTARIAGALGPLTRLVTWPAKDPNEWLQGGATAEDARALINNSEIWALKVAREAGETQGLEREAMIEQAMLLAARMAEFELAQWREELCKALGVGVREFNNLLRAAQNKLEASGNDEDEEKISAFVTTPGGLIGEHLVEMLVIPPSGEGNDLAGWSTKFAVRDAEGRITTENFLDVGGVRYVPVSAKSKILIQRVVQFPSAISDKKTPRELVTLIRSIIHKYVDVDPFYELLACYYIIFTWMYDSFNTLPYLRMLGDAGTGKSRFLQVVGAMCFRPIISTGAATVSPIFRIIDRYRGTLVYDEGDVRGGDETNEMIKILNTGYQRMQGIVLRSGDKNTNFEPEVFIVYGPKVIATRKRFQDWALESRCLTNEMGGPTMRADIPVDLPNDFWRKEATAVRNALLRYRLDYWQPEVELDYSVIDSSVEPRLNQIMVALLTLIKDPELRDGARAFIRRYNRQLIEERGMTLPARVLEAIITLYTLERNIWVVPAGGRLVVNRVAAVANIIMDYQNEMGLGDEKDDDEDGHRKQQALKIRTVGSIARKDLHLQTQKSSIGTRARQVVWDEARIEGLRRRYGLADDDWLNELADVVRKRYDWRQIYGLEGDDNGNGVPERQASFV